MAPHRIAVVDDHPIECRGLRELIANEPDLELAGASPNRPETLRWIGSLQPDLVLVDLAFGAFVDGLELVKELHAERPELAILAMSENATPSCAERVLRAGARGFVAKHEDVDVFLERIRAALRGDVAVSPDLWETVVQTAARPIRRRNGGDPLPLSDRELEIFTLIGQGVGTREIAHRLRVSPKTVETHRERIKAKLGLATAAELVARAVRFLLESEARSPAAPRS